MQNVAQFGLEFLDIISTFFHVSGFPSSKLLIAIRSASTAAVADVCTIFL
jgi:hypothetical protein